MVVDDARPRRLRIGLNHSRHDRVKPVGRNLAIRERIAGEARSGSRRRAQRRRIEDIAHRVEVASPHFRDRHCVHKRAFLPALEAFVVAEEKQLVLDDLAAEARAKLALAQHGLVRQEEVPRVGLVVAQKFVGAAVPLVRTRFRNHVHRRTGVAPLVGGEKARLDFELAHRFHRRPQHDGQRQPLVVVNAVVQEVVGAFAVSVREDFAARAKIVRSRTTHNGALGAKAHTGHARSKRRQLHKVAPVQRQFRHGLLFDNLANCRVVAIQ